MSEVKIEDYIRLCHWMAHRYRWSKAPMEDMVAGGIEGLAVAKERFDPSRGYKFITYAHWYVRSYVQKVVNHHIKENHQSLDVQDEMGRTGLDRVAAEEAETQVDTQPQVLQLLAALSAREALVIGRRFGIDVEGPSAHRQAVRAKEAAALKSMKKSV